MRPADHELLEPGMRVRIADRLRGEELYGGDDPEELKKWCGKEVTVRRVKKYSEWMVGIVEAPEADFYIEEIECIVEDAQIEESDIPLSEFIGMKGVPVCS